MLLGVAIAASALIAAWSAFSLRREFRRHGDRDCIWRRSILTGREDLRLGALTCSTTAASCSTVDALLQTGTPSHTAIVLALISVAATSAMRSLTERSDRRLLVYRDYTLVTARTCSRGHAP